MASIRWLALAVAVAACSSTTQTPASAFVCPGAAERSDAAVDATTDAGATEGDVGAPFRVLLFSRTAGFRHASIPTAIAQLMDLQATGGYVAEATEDPTQFSPDNLARFQVVVFLLTTGDVLDDDQQAAFEAWIGAGGGYVGVHSAADTEYDWPFYGTLMGAYFLSHPDIQPASVHVQVMDQPATIGLPSPWVRTDEWYNFQTNPRPNVTVLATVDESTYTGGTMGTDHPITSDRRRRARVLYGDGSHRRELLRSAVPPSAGGRAALDRRPLTLPSNYVLWLDRPRRSSQ